MVQYTVVKMERLWVLYHTSSFVKAYAESNPPTKRMFISKTETCVFY